jgi:DNA-binding response OmpR family regulator
VLPDVVLIDIMLPGIDGFELCRTLASSQRRADRHGSRPENDTHDVVAGLEAGADDYLTKAVRPQRALRSAFARCWRRIRPISPSHARPGVR